MSGQDSFIREHSSDGSLGSGGKENRDSSCRSHLSCCESEVRWDDGEWFEVDEVVIENTVEDLLDFLIPLINGEIDFDNLKAASWRKNSNCFLHQLDPLDLYITRTDSSVISDERGANGSGKAYRVEQS